MPIIFGTTASGGDKYFTPQPPTIGTATNVGTSRAYNNGAATVTFTPSTSGGTATSFTATSTPGSYTGSASSSPVTVAGLQSATAYTFAVTATDSEGTSSASSASNSVTATTVPQAPTIGTATDAGTGTSVTVAYTAGATGGSTITGYTATSSPGGLTGTGASPITVSGLTAGTAYTFTVTATNANGTSAASAASNSVTPVVPYNFFLISQQTLSSTTATVTFSSIPSTYKSLQIRYNTLTSSVGLAYYAQFNGDTGNNYAWHALATNGSSVVAVGSSSTNHIPVGVWDTGSGGATAPTVGIVDIIDYANTSKNKTVKSFSGTDDNSTRHDIDLDSGLWLSTAAINSVSISPNGGNLNAGSTFSLYGVS